MDFEQLRKKYPKFIYDKYTIEETDTDIIFTFTFIIPELVTFTPQMSISKADIKIDYDKDFLGKLVFHIGLIELVSYFKCTCSPNVEIKAGYLDEEQIKWFKKLYYYGLGEFMYINKIVISEDNLMHITCPNSKDDISKIDYEGHGNIITIGGGKDSVVALNLLAGMDNTCFMINPKKPGIACCKEAGYNSYFTLKRTIDPNLLELNKKGFLNGHTPFSSLVAFTSYLVAYLTGRKYIVLSNEGSANEPTILGTKINHQYSKTFEFENDFNNYTNKYFNIDIHYFSILRPLSELQIAFLFAQYKNYHQLFRSCNVGSKKEPWNWCCSCPKCLFVYIILSPFLTKEELINIFGEDLYDNIELLPTLLELAGYRETKPFECVGTYSEVRNALSMACVKWPVHPYLLTYYQDNYLVDPHYEMLKSFNTEHNVPPMFLKILQEELERVNELIVNDK